MVISEYIQEIPAEFLKRKGKMLIYLKLEVIWKLFIVSDNLTNFIDPRLLKPKVYIT